MVEEIHIDWGKAFSFLFPDGNVLHASWLTYAIIALVLAFIIELGTQLLYLLVRVSLLRGANWPVCSLQIPSFSTQIFDIQYACAMHAQVLAHSC